MIIYTVDELKEHEVNIILTRRIVLSNVSKIFDPAGFLCPVTLLSKLLLRESWKDQAIGWDDPLPQDQVTNWLSFFKSLLELNKIQIPRSLWPAGEVVGMPSLIIFSDGSISAYGVAAYIRWKVRGGGYWCHLIMSNINDTFKNQTKWGFQKTQ